MSAVSRRLVFLGHEDASSRAVLMHEGAPIAPGALLVIERRRSPWSASREVERAIIGSHPTRADLLIRGEAIGPEHARFYLSRSSAETNDLRAIEPHPTAHNGETVGHEWRRLESGDEVCFGPWRFRFEMENAARG